MRLKLSAAQKRFVTQFLQFAVGLVGTVGLGVTLLFMIGTFQKLSITDDSDEIFVQNQINKLNVIVSANRDNVVALTELIELLKDSPVDVPWRLEINHVITDVLKLEVKVDAV